jgi:SAM-dependent methyltransferase/predicted transcriptional regulator
METKPDIIPEVRSFMKSRVILSAAELDFFSRLDGNFLSAKELAETSGLDERATTRILDCLITYDLLEKENNRYRTTEKGSQLSSQNRESRLPMVKHMNHIWKNWSHLTEVIKKGTNPYVRPVVDSESKADRNAFIGAMHVAARRISAKIADAYDLSSFKKLLDIGGGSGAYTIAFLNKNPNLNAVIFDLEGVIPIAKEKIHENNFQDKVDFVVGDFYVDDLPYGCDIALLSAIIHQNSPQQNVELYRKIYKALDPGGTLIIRDHIMDESRINPPAGALFALNMLVNTQGGDTYTFREVKDTLKTAGFEDVKLVISGKEMDCLVESMKPNSK